MPPNPIRARVVSFPESADLGREFCHDVPAPFKLELSVSQVCFEAFNLGKGGLVLRADLSEDIGIH